jgi:hypothetical protein
MVVVLSFIERDEYGRGGINNLDIKALKKG